MMYLNQSNSWIGNVDNFIEVPMDYNKMIIFPMGMAGK